MSLTPTPTQPQTAYERMCIHHAKHSFKRGANEGDAPLDTYQRYAHKRIRITPTHAEVILHRTVLVRAYPDGIVTLHTDNWRSNTTKDTLSHALRIFMKLPVGVYSSKRFGLSQWHFYDPTRRSYAFYEGMRISPEGLPFDPAPFMRRRLNPELSRPFARAAREFKQTFHTLFSALPDTRQPNRTGSHPYYSHNLSTPLVLACAITSQPELWPIIVEHYAYGTYAVQGHWTNRKMHDPAAVLRAILTQARAGMYHNVPTTTFTV